MQTTSAEQPKTAEKTASNKITLKLNAPFQVETPEGDISDSGKHEIEKYLSFQALPTLPESLEWVWATNRGTLPKRIASHCYKAHNVKITPLQMSELGNIARRNSSSRKTYTLDFTGSIDWEDGDFGDGGSCFWGDRSGAKEMLEENGYAVRAYQFRPYQTSLKYECLIGYARAWLAQLNDSTLIVFNGYGETALTFARLLALKFKTAYKRIYLTNKGNDDGTLWINGGNAYIIGQFASIQAIERHDLGWSEPERQNLAHCYNCGVEHDADDLIATTMRSGAVRRCCEDCSASCEDCGGNFHVELISCMDGRINRCLSCEERAKAEQQREEKENAIQSEIPF